MTNSHLNSINEKLIIPQVLSADFKGQENIDLNEVLQEVLEKYSAEQYTHFILRFDTLPMVSGEKEHFVCLFDALVFMIISHPPVNSKLFMYVKCAEEKQDEDIIDLRGDTEKTFYKIDFYSNINTDQAWKLTYHAKLSECALQATKNEGNFYFSPISNTGCIFSVILPGKIN